MITKSSIAPATTTAVLLIALSAFATESRAQSAAEFYKGKSITMMIGSAPGGGYDTHGRLLARHMGKHIPGNPKFVAQNNPAASSMVATNYVANVAPKDGTVIAGINRPIPYEPLFGNTAAKYDPLKLNWLGSTNREVGIFIAWHTAPHRSYKDLLDKELVVGGTSPGADTVVYANLLKNMFGAKLNIVRGYRSSAPLILALERGEVLGVANYSWTSLQERHADWVRDKKVYVLLQIGLAKHPDLPDVPLITELARNDEERGILELILAQKTFGRPYFVAEGVPADRVAALRAAFMATVRDEAYLGDANKAKQEISPASGEEMQQGIARIYAMPKDAVKKADDVRKD